MPRQSPGVSVHLAALAVVVLMLDGLLATPAGQAPPAAQLPPRTAAPAPAGEIEGAARVTGQVVAADTGAPVKRLALSVFGGVPRPATGAPGPTTIVAAGSPPSGMIRREVMTDEAGRFECGGLPAGRYSVSVRDTGMFVAPPPAAVDLAAGGSASLTIRLDRGGSITGRVLDDEGDPVVKAQVVAGQRRSVGGAWRLMQTGSAARATTDDLGQFRLYGLPAGEFYVSAALHRPDAGAWPGSARRRAARRVCADVLSFRHWIRARPESHRQTRTGDRRHRRVARAREAGVCLRTHRRRGRQLPRRASGVGDAGRPA